MLALPSRTGIGSYVAALERGLPAAGLEVTTHTLQKRELRLLGKAVGGDLSQRLLRFAPEIPDQDAHRPRVVHATSSHVLHKLATVATVHDLNPLAVGGRLVERTMLRRQGPSLRRLRAVMTDSAPVRDECIERYGLDAQRVHVVPLGVDHDVMHPAPAAPLAWAGPTVLYVGDCRPYKGLREAIQTVAALPGVHLARVGPAAFDAYGRACIQDARRSLGARFHDLGFVPRAELRQLYIRSDLVWFPSRHEGFGFPPLEAAACGTQSLVWDNALNREHLGQHAEYVDSLAPERLLEATRSRLANPIPHAVLIAQAARFTWQATCDAVIGVYETSLEG